MSPEAWETAITPPRRYGFHATLKPPFRLSEGSTERELLDALEAFTHTADAARLGTLKLAALSGFLALRPEREGAVGRLAADIVREFDRFRAPLTQEETARRKPQALNDRQRDLLDRWGYPYVMSEFRFHMTLTGRLSTIEAEAFRGELQERLSPEILNDVSIDEICLFVERNPGDDFVLMQRFPLADVS